MAPLAELLASQGWNVSGSDQKPSKYLAILKSKGISVQLSHDPDYITSAQTVVYSSAIPEENPELSFANSKNLTILHRSDLLALLVKGTQSICVSGTHGKTTTSSIIAHIVRSMKLSPTVIIGGRVSGSQSLSNSGSSELLVAEVDESDGTLVKYVPTHSIILNIDEDHMEYFKSVSNLKKTFFTFAKNSRKTTFFGIDNPNCREIYTRFCGKKSSFGFSDNAEIKASNYQSLGAGSLFTAQIQNQTYSVEIPIFGEHNVLNTLAALAGISELPIDINEAIATLRTYKSVDRRLSILHKSETTVLIDDYAHNPVKIQSCIKAVKNQWPLNRLIVLFEPHRFSRIKSLYKEFTKSFSKADIVRVLPFYTAGETETFGLSSKRLSDDISTFSKVPSKIYNNSELFLDLQTREQAKQVTILCIGAGDASAEAHRIKERLDA